MHTTIPEGSRRRAGGTEAAAAADFALSSMATSSALSKMLSLLISDTFCCTGIRWNPGASVMLAGESRGTSAPARRSERCERADRRVNQYSTANTTTESPSSLHTQRITRQLQWTEHASPGKNEAILSHVDGCSVRFER